MNTPVTPPPAGRTHRDRDPGGLRRLRWAVRAALMLGVAASIAANVLHARPNLISQLIAAWPPLALMLTVELISRIPADRRGLATARLISAAIIAGIAAWVSYWHMVGVAAHYGETSAHADYLLPLSVDGLVVVASISLVELAGRITQTRPTPGPADVTTPATPPPTSATNGLPPDGGTTPTAEISADPAPAAFTAGPAPQPPSTDRVRTAQAMVQAPPSAAAPPVSDDDQPAALPGDHAADDRPPAPVIRADKSPAYRNLSPRPRTADLSQPSATVGPPRHHDPDHADAGTTSSNKASTPGRTHTRGPAHETTTDTGAVDKHHLVAPSDTAAAVAYWYHRNPRMHPADIASKISRSERTVRRYWPPQPTRVDDIRGDHPAE